MTDIRENLEENQKSILEEIVERIDEVIGRLPDSYEWEREKFASIVSEKSGIAREVLLDFLPQYPDYN